MAKTPTYAPNRRKRRKARRERGAALLEAAMALALVALVAGAGVSAFGAANRASGAAEAKLENLAKAENAIEAGSHPLFLRRALDEGAAEAEGDGWRLEATVYEDEVAEADDPMGLVRLIATAGDVRLETVRSLPR